MHPQIGPYRILGEIGHGGMGVVFRARDTRLERDVAIKALPADLADDPARLARFEREAKVLAALNHPAIAAIYGLEVAEGRRYLILEFIDGRTLADSLERGPLPVEEALPIARQIAEALEAAHEKGIVHRDLKPGNIMVDEGGRVKVLDFGLARASDDDSFSSRSGTGGFHPESPTVTSPAPLHSPTIAGAIMGTAGYMSPEQARGKPVDKRSDVFSFGCVLFEMLSGARPFLGETVTDSLGATLHKEADLSLLPDATPPGVRVLLRRCLEKNKHNRLHDIADARIALQDAITGADVAAAGVVRPPGWGRIAAAIVALLALGAAIAAGAWTLARRTAPPPPASPARVPARLDIPSTTSAYANAADPAVSPDGRVVLFSAQSVAGGEWGLWTRPLDSFEARSLAETIGAQSAFWSWDGRSIAFHADGKLWAVDAVSGGARRLIASEPGNYGAAWGPDGTIILSRARGATNLVRIPAAGGTPTPLTSLDENSAERVHAFPQFLPDGQRYMYLGVHFEPDQEVRIGRLYASRLGSDERTVVAPMLSRFWLVDSGWIVYVEDGVLKAAPFDMDALRITGEAITIADDVSYFKPFGAASAVASRDGTIALQQPDDGGRLAWFGIDGEPQGRFGPRNGVESLRISPDGTRVALSVSDRRTGLSDIWIHGIDRPSATRLTTDARWEGWPIWSRDSRTIYFSWDRRNAPEIYSISADGTGEASEVSGGDLGAGILLARAETPDRASLLITGGTERNGRDLMLLSLDGKRSATPIRSTAANEEYGAISPDGQWLAFNSDESGRPEVYLAPFSGQGAKILVSNAGGMYPVWSPAGDRLYFRQRRAAEEGSGGEETSKVMSVDLSRPESFRAPPAPTPILETRDRIGAFDVTPDGKRLLVQFTPTDTPALRIVLNALPPVRDSAP